MMRQAVQFILGGDWVRWIAGPIFEKELRVASRRRRSFVLRFAYIVLLSAFVLMIWATTMMFGTMSRAYRTSQSAEMGLALVACIQWFQFITMPLISLVLLSGSIGDEIYRRTLGVLMTTPITSFQIVLGKLASRMLEMVLLLATSLPLLAVVRVFGGVPWEYVVSGLCVTLTTTLFAGALSMWFSISGRRVWVAVIKTVVALALLYALIPVVLLYLGYLIQEASRGEGLLRGVGIFHDAAYWEQVLTAVIFHGNPYVVMYALTELSFSARGAGVLPFTFSWPLHCLITLGASAILVGLCVWRVRRVALAEITGDTPQARRRARRAARLGPAAEADQGRVRRVFGPPMIWKELRTRLARSRLRFLLVCLFALAVLGLTYLMAAENLDERVIHDVYVVVLFLFGVLVTTVVAATGIPSEKEAGTWPVLLGTPLSNWQIALGKAVGSIGRSLPVWLLLAFHLVLFMIVGYVHPIVAAHLAIVAGGVVVFLTGTGLFFGACFKRTTSAVAMNLCLALFLWALVPVLFLMFGAMSGLFTRGPKVLAEAYLMVHPWVQAVVATDPATGDRAGRMSVWALTYDWPIEFFGPRAGVLTTTAILLATMFGHMAVGLSSAALAALMVRRHSV